MADWTVKFEAGPFVALLERVSLGLEQRKVLHERLVIRAQQTVFRRWRTLEPGLSEFTMLSRSGSRPLSDKGTLRLSMTGSDPRTLATTPGTLNAAGESEGIFGSKLPYAAIHNYGGTIKAVTAKNLALPASKEARKYDSPRSFPRELYFVPERGDDDTATGWLAEKLKSRRKGWEKLVYHYLLTPRVFIPARRYMPTEPEFQPEAQKVGLHYMRELISGQRQSEAA